MRTSSVSDRIGWISARVLPSYLLFNISARTFISCGYYGLGGKKKKNKRGRENTQYKRITQSIFIERFVIRRERSPLRYPFKYAIENNIIRKLGKKKKIINKKKINYYLHLRLSRYDDQIFQNVFIRQSKHKMLYFRTTKNISLLYLSVTRVATNRLCPEWMAQRNKRKINNIEDSGALSNDQSLTFDYERNLFHFELYDFIVSRVKDKRVFSRLQELTVQEIRLILPSSTL